MLNNIDTILFDIDGTLINTDDVIIDSYHKVFKTFRPDYTLTKEEEISFLGPTLRSMFSKYFTNKFEDLLEVYHTNFIQRMDQLAFVYPHAKDLLEYLKKNGYKLGVVTSRFDFSAKEVLDCFDLSKYFEVVISLNDVKEPKPNPEGINIAIEKLSSSKEKTIYIGDNESDLGAAINAKVKAGLVTWSQGRNNLELNADFFVENYQDLLKKFQGE